MPVPLTVPTGATAVRPVWSDLPVALRRCIEAEVGGEIAGAASQGGGFTPGFASRLRLGGGRRVFVKAASEAQPWLLAAYRAEADKLVVLPAAVPAPRLRARLDPVIDEEQWVVLIFDDIDGRPPIRPWRSTEAERVVAATARTARALTPAPAARDWSPLQSDLADSQPTAADLSSHPMWGAHANELVALIGRADDLLAGNTLVHGDLRDDNVILDRADGVWFCDWNWPTIGPQWADLVCLLISVHGDGLNAERLLAGSGLATAVDREAIDCWLAVLTGYFLTASQLPPVPHSPYLRVHQTWYARAAGDWLGRRRAWVAT